MDTIIDISIYLFNGDKGMAIGPVLGYIHQYYVISKSKSIGCFSIDICGILLFANILRLNFYVFNKFATALLWQSINMIIVQVFLIKICTKWRDRKTQYNVSTDSSDEGENPNSEKSSRSFWRWHQFSTYFLAILSFTFVSFSITLMFFQLEFEAYGVFVGLAALLSQSVLILPQIIRNYKRKCTQGLSYLLVASNLFGDIFKLVYFILKKQAFQFIVCGVIQVLLDSFVIFQIYFYRKNKFIQQKDHKQNSIEKDHYNINDMIQTETEKNFDDVEMIECDKNKQASTDNTQGGSERKSQIKQNQKDDDIVYTKKEWGMKYQSTNPMVHEQHFEKHLKTIVQQDLKVNESQIIYQSGNNQLTAPNTVPFRKALSSRNNPIHGSNDYFQPNFVLPPKSLENVKVQG